MIDTDELAPKCDRCLQPVYWTYFAQPLDDEGNPICPCLGGPFSD